MVWWRLRMWVGGENGARLRWVGTGFWVRLLRGCCVFLFITTTPECFSKSSKTCWTHCMALSPTCLSLLPSHANVLLSQNHHRTTHGAAELRVPKHSASAQLYGAITKHHDQLPCPVFCLPTNTSRLRTACTLPISMTLVPRELYKTVLPYTLLLLSYTISSCWSPK